MFRISNNLEELNYKKRNLINITAATLLERLGFTLQGNNDIAFDVTLPDGWTHENFGWPPSRTRSKTLHTVFRGPNGEEVWSFIKYDPWNKASRLEAWGISEDVLV